jgi:hypothetical protein
MPLHLMKLCVGIDSIERLAEFQARRLEETGRNAHVTRQTPRRAPEILDGGSLYWVIGGLIRVRQRILAIEPFTGEDGTRRCRIELDPRLVPVTPRRQRAFQGWRYLRAEDAPPDLSPEMQDPAAGEPPPGMREALRELCLL